MKSPRIYECVKRIQRLISLSLLAHSADPALVTASCLSDPARDRQVRSPPLVPLGLPFHVRRCGVAKRVRKEDGRCDQPTYVRLGSSYALGRLASTIAR